MSRIFSASLRCNLSLALLLALASATAYAAEAAPAAAPLAPQPSVHTEVPEQAAIFKKVQGAVSVRSSTAAKAQARPVASGDALAVGERVHTGKDAGASFTLSDGTELMLGARSSAVVREYTYNSTTQEGNILIEFLGGQLRVISGLISKKKPESLKVQAPSAVVGVRGTDFVLEAPTVDE
jgi:hypothetical protein